MTRSKRMTVALGIGIPLFTAAAVLAGGHEEKAGSRNVAEMTFGPLPNIPTCLTGAVQKGDPHSTAFTLLAKAKTGCVVPWHWHSSGEMLMIVGGAATISMRDGTTATSVTLKAGGFSMLPAKHVHQLRCKQTCTFFLSSEGAFDIHYVDPSGTEITPEEALKPSKETISMK